MDEKLNGRNVAPGLSSMIFPSVPDDIIVITGTGADLTFPSVVIAGLPTGAVIHRADIAVSIGALFDTSAAENQIKTGTTDELHIKASAAAWAASIACMVWPALGLQVDADAYRGGCVLFGAVDVKSVVIGNGTYNFQSDETAKTKAVEATGGNIELLDVQTIIRVWFR